MTSLTITKVPFVGIGPVILPTTTTSLAAAPTASLTRVWANSLTYYCPDSSSWINLNQGEYTDVPGCYATFTGSFSQAYFVGATGPEMGIFGCSIDDGQTYVWRNATAPILTYGNTACIWNNLVNEQYTVRIANPPKGEGGGKLWIGGFYYSTNENLLLASTSGIPSLVSLATRKSATVASNSKVSAQPTSTPITSSPSASPISSIISLGLTIPASIGSIAPPQSLTIDAATTTSANSASTSKSSSSDSGISTNVIIVFGVVFLLGCLAFLSIGCIKRRNKKSGGGDDGDEESSAKLVYVADKKKKHDEESSSSGEDRSEKKPFRKHRSRRRSTSGSSSEG